MAGGTVPSYNLSIKVSDLSNSSHLKTLIEDQAKPAFEFAAELAPYWAGPVEKVPSGTNFKFSLSDDAKWKTSTGIGFGLTATADCQLDILTKGAVLQYRSKVDADDKSSLPEGAYTGVTYIKLSADFKIDGNISGQANVDGIGIAGNAKGSTALSLVFAHPVKNGTSLQDAVKEGLDHLVFPFQPGCAGVMDAGDIAQVNFSGTLSCDVQLTYGLGKFSFAAPSATKALLRKTADGVGFIPPSDTVSIGATASVGYTHSDDFTAIVDKTDPSNAFLYLMRAQKNDGTVSVGVSANVNVTNTDGVSVDPKKLEATVNSITKGRGGSKIISQAGNLEKALNGKLDDCEKKCIKDGAGIKATWDAEHDTTMLFKYKVNLNNVDLQNRSWQDFALGKITSAVAAGGLILDSGSGIADAKDRSITIGITFFNLFHAQTVDKYFEKSAAVITDAGDIRFLYDVGDEGNMDVKGVLTKARIEFIADATATQPADVKLQIELCATKNKDEAHHIAGVAAYLEPNQQAVAAYNDMQAFNAAHPDGTLNLTCILEPSAYGKLTCSPYDGKKPPQDQSVDKSNWQVFHDAAIKLLGLDFAGVVTYAIWQQWNEAATGESAADRRSTGNWNGSGASAVWANQDDGIRIMLNYFCLASQMFMDLCDDLHRLAETVGQAKIPADWNQLLADLKGIVLADVNTDFAKPAVAAIVTRCAPKNVSYKKEGSGRTLTCTLNMS
jgi:hypothetical protein